MSVPATCPFCNALMPAAAPVAGRRVVCPRCGEAIGTVLAADHAIRPADGAVSQTERRHRSIRRVGMLAILAALVGIGLWAAWTNRHRIRSPFGPAAPEKPVVVKPAELPGLGYLPESTEAVLAVQMPFLVDRVGPDAENDPARALTSLGLPDAVIEIIDQASAVGLRNVDQFVLGLGFEGHAFPPQLVLVVHARQSFNLEAIARQLKAHSKKKDGRTLYVGKAGPLPEVNWWQAADRVLVATITARDFEGVPGQPRTGIDHLRPGLATLVRERVAEDACAWFVATSDKWDRYLQPYVLLPFTPLQGRKDLIKPAERLRSIALSIPNDDKQPIDVQIAVKSVDAGAELRSALAERFRGEEIEVGGDEDWVRVQIANDLTRVGGLVSRLTAGEK
jgi:hypothetical protein